MTPAITFAGRTVALFGLGGSGNATALALQAGGAEVVAFDDNPKSLAKASAQASERAICALPTGRGLPRWYWRPACP